MAFSDNRIRRRRRVVVGVLALAAVGLVAAIIWLPPQVIDTHGLGPEARLKAENDFRGTLATLLGGMAVLGGSAIAVFNLVQSRDYNRHQLDLQRQGQVNERFIKAIDQLGSSALDTRVGAIYALEQIAKDSDKLGQPIVETLTAFLREHSRGAVPRSQPRASTSYPPPPPADFQAAATVLSRRPESLRPTAVWLNLRAVNLRRSHLENGHLDHARLRRALLERAHLKGAHLYKAGLQAADLRHADLRDVDLRKARLQKADLTNAILEGADLRGTDLSEVIGVTEGQINSAITDVETIRPGHH